MENRGALEWRKGDFHITTSGDRMDVDVIHRFLCDSYWARGIPRETVEKSVRNSLCFGLFRGPAQIGFARAVSDCATFAYLADVFLVPEYRGRGLGKWLVESIMAHPQLQGLRRWMLVTRDAHGLYAKCGFRPLAHPERLMEIHSPALYAQQA